MIFVVVCIIVIFFLFFFWIICLSFYILVAQELQYLFAKLVLTRRKYIDPTDFLNTLVDKEGNCIHRGAQEDPTGLFSFFKKFYLLNTYVLKFSNRI